MGYWPNKKLKSDVFRDLCPIYRLNDALFDENQIERRGEKKNLENQYTNNNLLFWKDFQKCRNNCDW